METRKKKLVSFYSVFIAVKQRTISCDCFQVTTESGDQQRETEDLMCLSKPLKLMFDV